MPRLRSGLFPFVSFCFLLANLTTAQGQSAWSRDVPRSDPAYHAYARLVKLNLAPAIVSSCTGYGRHVGPPRLTRYEFAVAVQRSVGPIVAALQGRYPASVRRAANLLAREFAPELRELGGLRPARKVQKS